MLALSTVSFRSPRLWVRRGFMTFFLLLAAHCLLLTARGQTADPTETIRIDTDLANLNVSVFNRKTSRAIAPLEQKDFAVFENGQAQEILFFAAGDAPFDLVLLLDLSGSTAKKIDLIRKSAKRF